MMKAAKDLHLTLLQNKKKSLKSWETKLREGEQYQQKLGLDREAPQSTTPVEEEDDDGDSG